jgi:hypothetical protein
MTSVDDAYFANGNNIEANFMAAGNNVRFGFTCARLGGSQGSFDCGGSFGGSTYGVWSVAALSETSGWTYSSYTKRAGVMGSSPDATGVAGTAIWGPGVYGHEGLPDDQSLIPNGLAAGVVGTSSNWPGVLGWSTHLNGVTGVSYDGDAGVVGAGGQARGVVGVSSSYTFSGVEGFCGEEGPTVDPVTVAGVLGSSDAQHGVIGTSNAGFGVYGFSSQAAGVFGQTSNPAAYAGVFLGNVRVRGTLTATVKHGVVPFPDGTQRVLHCMESPEHWFEDFGAAKLKSGRAVVKLDADFAKVVNTGDYRVFVTPEGDCHGLYVRGKRAASFEVRELMGGKSNIAFCYRIVGRRKDIRGHRRFAKVDPLPLVASPPRTPTSTASAARSFVAMAEREARTRRPKVSKKGRRSRGVPKYLRPHMVAPSR